MVDTFAVGIRGAVSSAWHKKGHTILLSQCARICKRASHVEACSSLPFKLMHCSYLEGSRRPRDCPERHAAVDLHDQLCTNSTGSNATLKQSFTATVVFSPSSVDSPTRRCGATARSSMHRPLSRDWWSQDQCCFNLRLPDPVAYIHCCAGCLRYGATTTPARKSDLDQAILPSGTKPSHKEAKRPFEGLSEPMPQRGLPFSSPNPFRLLPGGSWTTWNPVHGYP